MDKKTDDKGAAIRKQLLHDLIALGIDRWVARFILSEANHFDVSLGAMVQAIIEQYRRPRKWK